VTVRISSRRPVGRSSSMNPFRGFRSSRRTCGQHSWREDAGVHIAASDSVKHHRPGSSRRWRTRSTRWDDRRLRRAEGLPAILEIEESAVSAARDAAVEQDKQVEPLPIEFDLWLNTVPDQGAVVRTEEALFATLAPSH